MVGHLLWEQAIVGVRIPLPRLEISMIDKEKAKDCDYCSGKGIVGGACERPCPKCQRHAYRDKPVDNLQKVLELREEIRKLENNLGALKYSLQNIEEKCGHKEWSEPERLAERIYDMEANVKWQRTCKNCGLVQSTSRVREKKVEEPIF